MLKKIEVANRLSKAAPVKLSASCLVGAFVFSCLNPAALADQAPPTEAAATAATQAAPAPAAGTATPAPPATPATPPATASTPAPPAKPEEPKETVTLVRHSNKAADYYKEGDWGRARDEYRTCIGLAPKSIEYYEGLYNTCMHDNEWDQVAYALNEIFKLDAKKRDTLAYEYGLALFHLNKFDEAEPALKRALASTNLSSPPFEPKVKPIPISVPTTPLKPVVVAPPPPKIEKPKVPEKPTGVYRLSYENAIHSESIVLAEYEGFQSGDIHWNNPPMANYHIEEILKGPPLNKALPVKYEFHDSVNTAMPKGWKFSPSLMPAKGSKWILFIEFAVPKQGAFETYEGNYGRQEASEDNLNQLYQLLDAANMRLQK
ncbi:MAG TPA: hypothetical protein V6C72_16890 [Chroococcales cyanobacterium]